MKPSTLLVLGSLALVLVAFAVFLAARNARGPDRTVPAASTSHPVERPARPSVSPPKTPPPSLLPSPPEDLGSAPEPATDPLLQLGERELMNELRALLSVDDERVVLVTRSANERWPASVDAPERAWMLVKSLDRLQRHHEARAEAERMVLAYPDASFSGDVRRHVLVYPLDQPSREEMQQGAVPHAPGPED